MAGALLGAKFRRGKCFALFTTMMERVLMVGDDQNGRVGL